MNAQSIIVDKDVLIPKILCQIPTGNNLPRMPEQIVQNLQLIPGQIHPLSPVFQAGLRHKKPYSLAAKLLLFLFLRL